MHTVAYIFVVHCNHLPINTFFRVHRHRYPVAARAKLRTQRLKSEMDEKYIQCHVRMDNSTFEEYYASQDGQLPLKNQTAIRTIIDLKLPRFLDNQKEDIFNFLREACRVIKNNMGMNGRTVITYLNYHFDVQLLRTDQDAVPVPEP